MTPNPHDEIFFVAGGTLKASTPSYVERPADAELFEAVMDGQLCYVLTPRQMGKSSLMTRTSRKLKENGIRTASIDLTSIGTQVTAQQWYTSIISQLTRQLNLGIDAQEWCKQQEGLAYIQTFTTFIEEIMLEKIAGRVVIFIDEIDSTLSLNFRDDFFAGLRAIYNARTDKPAFERIAFVLLGVASPSDLIADKARTPFNIGRAIALQEFDFAHAHVLQTGLDAIYPTQGQQILQRIFHWTSGHPYLTQKLCSEIVERKSETWNDATIDQLVHELFLSEQARKETNLKFVQDRLLDNPRRSALLGLYQRILRGKVDEEGQSALQNELKLSGLVRVDDGLLKVRNLIYETVFTVHWAQINTPKNWPKIAATILAVFSFILLSVFIYDAVASDLSKRYAGEVATARTSKERLYSLYNLFELKGIFTPNYAYLARESFYPLPWDKQIGLFTDPHIDAQDKSLYLVPVIRGLYVTMANVYGGQDSTELLKVMYASLNDVNSVEGQELHKEIGWWLKAREATTKQEALNNYNEAIALEADNPSTRFERAQVANEMGQTELVWSDLDTVIALAQNISTEANEKDIPTLTPIPTSTERIVSTELAVTSVTNTPPTITESSNTAIPVTPQPRIHPQSGYNNGPRESYQSSFFSIAYIRSAVSRLFLDNAGGLYNRSGDTVFPSQPNKYSNLASAGLLQAIDSNIQKVTTKITIKKFIIWVSTKSGITLHIDNGNSDISPNPNFPKKYVALVPSSTSNKEYQASFYEQRQLDKGEQILVEWDVDGADNNQIQIAPFIGILAAKGSQLFSPDKSMNLVLTAKNGGTESVYLLPIPVNSILPVAPKIEFFQAIPLAVIGSGDVKFSWSVSGEWDHIQITNSEGIVEDYVYPKGFKTLTVSKSDTYILTAWNGDLSSSMPLDITVEK